MQKPYSIRIFFSSFLSKSAHLSDVEMGIYFRMLGRIFRNSNNRYSFPNDDVSWSFYLGLESFEKLDFLRKLFLNKKFRLFSIVKRNNSSFVICPFLQKSYIENSSKSKIYSSNALCRDYSKAYPHAIASPIASISACPPTPPLSSSSSLSSPTPPLIPISPFIPHLTPLLPLPKKARANSRAESSDSKDLVEVSSVIKDTPSSPSVLFSSPLDVINNMLIPFLSKTQIARIITMMPNLTPEYVLEKINLTKSRNPSNRVAFLYASIIQNYIKPDNIKISSMDSLFLKAKNRPLSASEYSSLSPDLQSLFKIVPHQKPGVSVFKLISMPNKIPASERFAFSNLKVGDEIDSFSFSKFCLNTQSFFSRSDMQPETVFMYHIK